MLFVYNAIVYPIEKKKVLPVMAVGMVIPLSFIIGYIQGNSKEINSLLFQYRAILPPLILILWSKYYDLLAVMKSPVIITAFIVCVFFFLIQAHPEVRILIDKLSSDPNQPIFSGTTKKEYLGIEVPSFYWGSLPSFTLILGFYLYDWMLRRSFKSFIIVLIVSVPFLVSGSRVPILTPFACLFLIIAYKINHLRSRAIKLLFCFIPIVLFGIFIYVTYSLASDVTETSNIAKYGHIDSYLQLFDNHPEYGVWGQGVGSEFYTSGFGKMTDITELTYFEMLRVYGLFSLIIMAVIVYPITKLWKYRDNGIVYTIIWSYIVFLVSAGTNPKLLNTAGMIIVLVMYSFMDRVNSNYSLTRTQRIGIHR